MNLRQRDGVKLMQASLGNLQTPHAMMQQLVDGFSQVVQAEGHCVMDILKTLQEYRVHALPSSLEERSAVFLRGYALYGHLDPSVELNALGVQLAGLVKPIQIFGKQAWFESQYGREFFTKQQGLRDELNYFLLDGAGRPWIGLAGYHGRTRDGFNGGCEAILRDLYETLQQGLLEFSAWQGIIDPALSVVNTVPETDMPLLVLRKGRYLAATAVANQIVNASGVSELRNLALRELEQLASVAVGRQSGRVVWLSSDGRPWRVSTTKKQEGLEAYTVVCLQTCVEVPPVLRPLIRAGMVRGLSLREAHILAMAVGQDAGNAEIAWELGLSVHTVRAHLRYAYRKLGASGRSKAGELLRQDTSLIRKKAQES